MSEPNLPPPPPSNQFARDLHDCTPSTDPRRRDSPLSTSLTGKNAIVFGGGRGVGRAIAEFLVHASARSIACFSLEASESEETIEICKKINPEIKTFSGKVDVKDFADVKRVVEEAERAFGEGQGTDIAVMNAGRPGQWLEVSESDSGLWWDTVAVSLQGAFNASKVVIPGMQRRGKGGRIIFTSSSGAHMSQGMSGYVVGKLGQVRLAEIIHVENFKSHGIKAFAYNPGCIKTRFFTDFEDVVQGKEVKENNYATPDDPLDKKSSETAYTILKDMEFDTPYMAAGLVTALAAGELDFMSGRYLDAATDIKDYIDRKDEILKDDLCRVRLNLGKGELVPSLDF